MKFEKGKPSEAQLIRANHKSNGEGIKIRGN